jgi:hypothetical protein
VKYFEDIVDNVRPFNSFLIMSRPRHEGTAEQVKERLSKNIEDVLKEYCHPQPVMKSDFLEQLTKCLAWNPEKFIIRTRWGFKTMNHAQLEKHLRGRKVHLIDDDVKRDEYPWIWKTVYDVIKEDLMT